MERAELYWLWLFLKGINNRKSIQLLKHLGSIDAVYQGDKATLSAVGTLTPKELSQLLDKDLSVAQAELEMCDTCGFRLLTFDSPYYPQVLRNLSDAPLLFYTSGDWEILKMEPKLTVVGPRESDQYGNDVAFTYAKELASAGVVIVSGMAKGIDGFSHAGALRGRGKTIALLGCGIDVDYPVENLELKREVAEKGLILSEFPLGTEPYKHNFPFRNRVLSALSDAVLVVQAGRRSGALITAHCAIDQGKDVFAIPGAVTSTLSEGVNRMIRDGEATMVISPLEVLSELHSREKTVISPIVPEPAIKRVTKDDVRDTEKKTEMRLTEEEKTILSAMEGEKDVDRLSRDLGMSVGELNSILVLMELSGLVEKLPGNRYRRK